MIENILQDVKSMFSDKLYLSVFGARVCYTSKTFDNLIVEDYFFNESKAKEFLKKLTNYKHFSVFSHTFNYFKVKNAEKLHKNLFKSIYVNDNTIGLSLRHILENVPLLEREHIIDTIPYKTPSINSIKSLSIPKYSTVYLLDINDKYEGYCVFYVTNISRACSHQIVRHTKLNFSQRSQRYVLEQSRKSSEIATNVFVPDRIINSPEVYQEYQQMIFNIEEFYKRMVTEYKIPAEDARYILPNAQLTSMVISGTLTDIKDFISKRETKEAQDEIRNVAILMKELINNA